MLSSISIQGFKAITKELKLNNLAPINYLIGPNGSGKSSVLEGIHLFWLSKNLESTSESFKNLIHILKENDSATISIHLKNRNRTDILKLEIRDKEIKIENKEIDDFFLKPSLNLYYRTDSVKWQKDILSKYFNKNDENKEFLKNVEESVLREINHELSLLINYGVISSNNIANEYLYKLMGCWDTPISYISDNFFTDSNIRDLTVPDIYTAGDKSFQRNNHSFEDGLHNLVNLIHFLVANLNNSSKKIILIDEPENHLHPTRQKQLPIIFDDISKELLELKINIQFLISTHSPFIINSALELDRERYKSLSDEDKNNFKPTHKVYHLDKVDGITKLVGEIPTTKAPTAQEGNFVSTYDSILGSIGVQPSDLLFANGVIWVEGPLDALYIEKWLNLFQKDKPKKFRKGLHYSIQCLSPGGWAYASLNDLENKEYPEAEEIIKLIELSRRNFLVIDSDTDLTVEGGNNNNNSKLTGHKKGEIKEKLITRFRVGNFQITRGTIENYLHKLIAKHPKYTKYQKDYTSIYEKKDKEPVDLGYCFMKNNKRKIAKDIFQDSDLKFSDFCSEGDELYTNIQSLYSTIQSWN